MEIDVSRTMKEVGDRETHLADNLAMNDRLISGLDGGGVCEDGNVGIELPSSLRLGGFSHQHHPLPHQIPLHFLQG